MDPPRSHARCLSPICILDDLCVTCTIAGKKAGGTAFPLGVEGRVAGRGSCSELLCNRSGAHRLNFDLKFVRGHAVNTGFPQ
jgi:hypothetical protein